MKWFEMGDGTLVNADNADYVTPFVKNDLNATISFTVVFQGGTKLTRSYILKDRSDLTTIEALKDYGIFKKLTTEK